MRLGWVWRAHHMRLRTGSHAARRSLSVSVQLRAENASFMPPSLELSRTRNIGIIAHIDAGKTTTTERMLYYSGYTRRIGDVDEGSTVTDFLPAERARGITIQSAAITFNWPPLASQAAELKNLMPVKGSPGSAGAPGLPLSSVPHNINLIDTPGHSDFTFEVIRSLRILDGAVCILDGVAGVEAQTEKVWNQANLYRIPRIVYVNKLDRDGAAFAKAVKEVGIRLHAWPAVCQVPWWEGGSGKLLGVGDVINMRGLSWEQGGDGKDVKPVSLDDLAVAAPELVEEMKKARAALVELLSQHDEEMVEKFLEYGDHLAIPAGDITESLRRRTLEFPQRVVPVFAGASFRNIGVQPVLDAVVDLLPSPQERPDPEISIASTAGHLGELLSGKLAVAPAQEGMKGKKLKAAASRQPAALIKSLEACALAFKVVNDAKRGVLVYVRVYSGTLNRNAPLFNTNLHVTERAPRLLKMYASDAVEVQSIPSGQIGVIAGLKHARTGDTLIAYAGVNPKVGPPAPINSLQLRPIAVPPPVFFTSVEPNSLSEEKHVADSLGLLLREDPSLHVSLDPESGQTHLAGMGELHLEIARDRLIKDLKAKATTGKIEIGYREAVLTPSPRCAATHDREIAGKSSKASCSASVQNVDDVAPGGAPPSHGTTTIELEDNNLLTIHHPDLLAASPAAPDSASGPVLDALTPDTIVSSLQTGASAALSRGPQYGYPVSSTHVQIFLSPTSIHSTTTPAALSAAARQATKTALRESTNAGVVLMEPVMLVSIAVPESDIGAVSHDLSSARGAQVLSLDGELEGPSTPAAGNGAPSTDPALAAAEDDVLLIDPKAIYAPPDPFAADTRSSLSSHQRNRTRQIVARVPLKEMVGYLKHLRSLTAGRGTFIMQVDRFERMSGQRQKAVLGEMLGER